MPGTAHWVQSVNSGTTGVPTSLTLPDIVLPAGSRLVRLLWMPRYNGIQERKTDTFPLIRPMELKQLVTINSAEYPAHVVYQEDTILWGQTYGYWQTDTPHVTTVVQFAAGFRDLGFERTMSFGGMGTSAITIHAQNGISLFQGGGGVTLGYAFTLRALYEL